MRYLAILKDSLREAWDSWVLLVLLGLSTLVILFVAQLSFHPQSAEKTFAYFFSRHGFQPPLMFKALNSRKPEKLMMQRGEWAGLHLKQVELTRGDADSPQSDYALTVVVDQRHFGAGPGMDPPPAEPDHGNDRKEEKKKPAADPKKDAARIRTLFEDAEDLGYVKVGDITPVAAPEENKDSHLYRVTIHGTPNTHRIWGTEPGLLFGLVRHEFFEVFAGPLAWQMYSLTSTTIGFGSWIAVLLGVVITSFFFPNMLRKGTVDLLLVKPISRWLLLVYKYFGGLAFIFFTTAYAIGGIWFVLGIRSGLWAHGALLLILSITFFFAILYAVSTLVGVVTRSVVASILLTIGAWVIFWVVGVAYSVVDVLERMEKADEQRREMMKQEPKPANDRWTGGWTFSAIRWVHTAAPRTEDLNQLNDLIIYTDFMTGNITRMGSFDNSDRKWWQSILVSCVWISGFLSLACAWFYYKDY